jgi:hypothetical protein
MFLLLRLCFCSDPVEGFPWFNLNFKLTIGQAQESVKDQNVVTESGAVLDFLNHNSKCSGECYAGKCVLDKEPIGEAPCWEQGANLLTCVPSSVHRLLQLLKKHC